MRETANGINFCNKTRSIPLLAKKPNCALCQMTIGREKLRMVRKRLEGEEPNAARRNCRGKTALPLSKVGIRPELPRDEASVWVFAEFIPRDENDFLVIAPVEECDDMPVAERTRHVEIPDRQVPEHRIELPRTRRAHGKRLLDEPHTVWREFSELVACERLLPGERDDRRLDLRLFACKRTLRDEHAVWV